ncbi:MAG: 3-dehydroquinate synthase [Chloroflexota bacterium]|nr:3-dehydroquinate synthase [Chloroflexota bacterium]
MAERLSVSAPDGAYPIMIAPGALAAIGAPDYAVGGAPAAIITNDSIAALYADRLRSLLPDATLIAIPDGEAYKTLATVALLYDRLIAAKLDRAATVIAFGGGVVGDIAGFAAATYLRGVRFVQVPTSLLAMVDSSVGGKVGVDLPQGKNLVGAFKQPAAVIIDPDLLATLPDRERRCGMAEIIKHGLIGDPGLLDWIGRAPTPENDAALVRRAVQVKIEVVQRDPYEQGERAHLNLGHTFGHAIEIISGFAFAHGEAVAIGLVAAAQLSTAIGVADASLVDRVKAWVESVGLPVSMGALDADAVYAAMGTDKKKSAGRLRFVVLRDLGRPEVVEGVDAALVIDVLKGISG